MKIWAFFLSHVRIISNLIVWRHNSTDAMMQQYGGKKLCLIGWHDLYTIIEPLAYFSS